MVEFADGMIKAPIIIDNVSLTQIFVLSNLYFFLKGSGVMKAGLGGDEKPTLNFNT